MSRTSPYRQSVMAGFFALVLVLNFGLVGWVAWEYEGNGQEPETLLFTTDSSTQFGKYTTSDNYVYYPFLNITTNVRYIKGATAKSFELTPAYLGNDSWGVSAPPLGDTPYDAISGVWNILVPNMQGFLFTHIDMNMSLPAVDTHVGFTVLHPPSAVFGLTTFGSADPPSQETNIVYSDPVPASTGYWLVDYDIPLTKSLRIYDLSQEAHSNALEIAYNIDDPSVGLATFPMTITVEIYGRQVSGWSLTDSMALAVGVGVVLNVVTVAFMSDELDIGGRVKDIRKRARRKR